METSEWLLIFLIVGVVLAAVIAILNSSNKSAQMVHESVQDVTLGRFRESKRFYADNRSIHISEFSKQWYIVRTYSKETPKIYNFSDIIDIQFVKDKEIVTSYKTSATSAIARGTVGGLLFGPIGALAGAATAKQKSNSEVTMKNTGIIILVRDLNNPQIKINCEYMSVKNVDELYSTLIVMKNMQES